MNTHKDINLDKLKRIVMNSDSFPEVTKNFGYDPKINSNIKKSLERLIKLNNISTEHFSTVKRVKEYKERYTKEKLIYLVKKYTTFKGILNELGIKSIDSNYKTLKKHLSSFNIDYSHLNQTKFKIINHEYNEINLKKIIYNSKTIKEVLEKLNLSPHGGNYNTIYKYIHQYKINTTHFNPNKVRSDNLINFNKKKIEVYLIENSTCNRGNLKKRLYDEGLKERECELCGQGEEWKGKKMSLILDHKNGINNDNRLKNLRIVCPNCNATFDTHCGKNKKKL